MFFLYYYIIKLMHNLGQPKAFVSKNKNFRLKKQKHAPLGGRAAAEKVPSLGGIFYCLDWRIL